jgi:uncharacterized protein YdhG (YjbR/CyaY superfamily)
MPNTRDANGYEDTNGRILIGVRIPKELFQEVKRFAVKENMSIAAKLRDYIGVGVQVDQDIETDA